MSNEYRSIVSDNFIDRKMLYYCYTNFLKPNIFLSKFVVISPTSRNTGARPQRILAHYNLLRIR